MGLLPGEVLFSPDNNVGISMHWKAKSRSPSATDLQKPFHSGYRRGSLQAQRLLKSIRLRRSRGRPVSPNELGYLIARLARRIEDEGGWAMSNRPIAQRSPEYQALYGEFHGLCAGIMDAL
jgi:hypothetical protein